MLGRDNAKLKGALWALFKNKEYSNKVSVCVIDLKSEKIKVAGYRDHKFIYPASVYKLFVAGALLDQIAKGRIRLSNTVLVSPLNAIDKEKEIPSDQRALLGENDRVSVLFLLNLMITRSDNTSANCLIDLVGRPTINRFVRKHGWHGSEITRKFLPRILEDKKYKKAPVTLSCARHMAEFLLLVERGEIGNTELSSLFKTLLGKQLDDSKIRKGLPAGTAFFHKTGWFDYVKDNKRVGYTGDCGIVISDNDARYIISVLTTIPAPRGNSVLALIGKKIHKLITTQ